MVKGMLAVWYLAVPVLPVEVPGAAVSPGSRIWSREKGPAAAGAAQSDADSAIVAAMEMIDAGRMVVLPAPKCDWLSFSFGV
jgi:hypothetical protein